MSLLTRRTALLMLACTPALSACSAAPSEPQAPEFMEPPLYPNETPQLRRLINQYADHYDVPRPLVHRLAIRESTHRPGARNGPYYGLLQILPATARSMGHQGSASDLLDAETNLKYGVKYLRGAWLLSDGDMNTAIQWYARGYYYEAKKRGMLVQTGLRKG
ncbi:MULTISPECIES: lytic transglycosylase domain-containing protein [Roseobacteraceae]|jgi:soluble lytic murein transglycosylase-like protein|uniref:Transglycosylase SLT domain protein n=1 Tax=Pseudosulfitobacter pseudonitzschiae TaxID=1402135 RepID=A0A221JZ38_9RHOB|nr:MULTISPECIES: lytic transglycosylase domain-containing protein [Roseobacteraceae]ASM71900.1 transglycosylase SLT domain protein [Pseudosulfitobacter pseudonitzschiae]